MTETKSKRHYIIRTLSLFVVAFAGDMIIVGLRLKLNQRPDIPLFVKSAMGFFAWFFAPSFFIAVGGLSRFTYKIGFSISKWNTLDVDWYSSHLFNCRGGLTYCWSHGGLSWPWCRQIWLARCNGLLVGWVDALSVSPSFDCIKKITKPFCVEEGLEVLYGILFLFGRLLLLIMKRDFLEVPQQEMPIGWKEGISANLQVDV